MGLTSCHWQDQQKREPLFIQMWRRRRSCREDSQVSLADTFMENFFISGVSTMMNMPLMPTTQILVHRDLCGWNNCMSILWWGMYSTEAGVPIRDRVWGHQQCRWELSLSTFISSQSSSSPLSSRQFMSLFALTRKFYWRYPAPGRDFYLLTSPSSVSIINTEQTPSELKAISVVTTFQDFSPHFKILIFNSGNCYRPRPCSLMI